MPGRTSWRRACSGEYSGRYSISSGRGPTRLISPASTLTSSGSSSRLVRRSHRPSAREALGVGQQRPAGVASVRHRAELHERERPAVAARARLAEQHRRAHPHPHEDARRPRAAATARRCDASDATTSIARASAASPTCVTRDRARCAEPVDGGAQRVVEVDRFDVGEQLAQPRPESPASGARRRACGSTCSRSRGEPRIASRCCSSSSSEVRCRTRGSPAPDGSPAASSASAMTSHTVPT